MQPRLSQAFVLMECPANFEPVKSHRLKAVALVTGCKPYSGQRPARWIPHQAGFKK
jgi:hypothetical protein